MASLAIGAGASILGPILGSLFGSNKRPGVSQDLENELINHFHQAGSESEGLRTMSAGLRNKFLAELQQRKDEGLGTPDFNIGTGEMLSPNARKTQAANLFRQGGLERQAGGMKKAGDLMGDINGSIDQYGAGINTTGDSIEGDIKDTFGRNSGRADAASGAVVDNIRDTFGGLRDATSGTYGALGDDTAKTFGGVRGETGAAYDETGKLIDTMDPSGMAAQARQSRAFEPAMASMALRLRKMGVDQGSPEYNAAMATVESDRARAMDDASIGERDKFIGAKSSNILGKAEKLGGLDLSNLGQRTKLSETQAGILRDLGLKAGDKFTDETIRNLTTQNNLDQTRSVESQANQNKTADRSVDYWNKKINAPLLESDLQHKDLATATEVANRGDKTDATNLGIDESLAKSGTAFHAADLAYKDDAMNALGTQAQQMWNNGATLDAHGLAAVNTAFNQPTQTPGSNVGGAIAGAVAGAGGAIANYLNSPSPAGGSTPNWNQPQTTSTGPSSMNWTPTFLPRAAGGPTNSGQAYMVGEKGPEMFTPTTPGVVSPNPASTPAPVHPWGAKAVQAVAPTPPVPQLPPPPQAPPAPMQMSDLRFAAPQDNGRIAADQLRKQGLGVMPGSMPTLTPEASAPQAPAMLPGPESMMAPRQYAPATFPGQTMTSGLTPFDPRDGTSNAVMAAREAPMPMTNGRTALNPADAIPVAPGQLLPGPNSNQLLAKNSMAPMDMKAQMLQALSRRRPPMRRRSPMPIRGDFGRGIGAGTY